MQRENKLVLSDFVNGDRFELNSYLTSLFNQYYTDVRDQSGDKMVKQEINQ
ncbi:MAG: hypothetical protein ACQEWV_11140 [Bacillota bacterium]